MIPTNRKVSIDDIQSDIGNIVHLVDEITTKVIGLDRGPDEARNHDLDRVGALLWVVRDMVERTEQQISDNISELRNPKEGGKC